MTIRKDDTIESSPLSHSFKHLYLHFGSKWRVFWPKSFCVWGQNAD